MRVELDNVSGYNLNEQLHKNGRLVLTLTRHHAKQTYDARFETDYNKRFEWIQMNRLIITSARVVTEWHSRVQFDHDQNVNYMGNRQRSQP